MPASRTRVDYKMFRSLQTRWADNDIYGHMNNVVHYQLFDTAINGWLLEAGLLELNGETIYFVGETRCRYFAQLRFPQEIEAGFRLARVGRSSLTYEIGLFVKGQATAAAEGEFTHIQVAREGHKSVSLSDDQRAKFTSVLV